MSIPHASQKILQNPEAVFYHIVRYYRELGPFLHFCMCAKRVPESVNFVGQLGFGLINRKGMYYMAKNHKNREKQMPLTVFVPKKSW